ncbi:hypothetical protein KS4_30190 [Poriferisphaera corsica]|uniref:Uncharacterized protein n=1 Tax=Poriferisphaera corsica TaxID=2528020 RepID=A0A517YXJ3_9BACT|nr:hypothetical protein KS4_30190 [Poriferisphaera corsica]
MGCLLGCLALAFPRLLMVILILFTSYLSRAYETILWPVLGFIFFPYTTIAYAFAYNQTSGHISGIYLVVIIFAVLVDLGSSSGSATSMRTGKS